MQCRSFYASLMISLFILVTSHFTPGTSQTTKHYWQQEIKYTMQVTLDVDKNTFTGKQVMKYKNNSHEHLNRVFFHLYLNAFQPGSAMDVRSRTISDPDPRVGDRILNLKPDEIGYQRITRLTQNGIPLNFETNGTILEVYLHKSLRPGQSVTLAMEYEAQVPVQIRRNGRDNAEGIRYSMSQWYPKLCEYDEDGWHANPYIAREFYGVWGDFDVSLTLDSDYVVAASGFLQNPSQVGHGYAAEPASKPKMLTWRFKANNVHDFVWAADPDYTHRIHKTKDGVVFHTFYQETPEYKSNWEALPVIMEEAMNYINSNFGKYPYPVYSFIQGGDGGMEYPMATLITGNRPLNSLVGVSVHEFLHSWYQMVLGFNESLYAWMDEGFTDYAETRVTEHLRSKGLISGSTSLYPYEGTYKAYKSIVERGIEEPLSTHADHFEYNTAYGIAAYVKGSVFLHQLEYVIGKEAFARGMLNFYNSWKFKHPDADVFMRIMEKNSDMELDWYKEYMVYSTKTVDYAVDTIYESGGVTTISLERIAQTPMPIDLWVKLKNGKSMIYTIPLDLMRNAKREQAVGIEWKILPDWNWVNPTYEVDIPFTLNQIESVEIDASKRLADVNREDNQWPPVKS